MVQPVTVTVHDIKCAITEASLYSLTVPGTRVAVTHCSGSLRASLPEAATLKQGTHPESGRTTHCCHNGKVLFVQQFLYAKVDMEFFSQIKIWHTSTTTYNAVLVIGWCSATMQIIADNG